MEFTISRRSLSNVLGLGLIAIALFGGYYAWSMGLFDGWFSKNQSVQTVPANEPALMSLATLYSPSRERVEWEKQVCEGMTEKGCGLFHSMFAEPIWNSSLKEHTSSATFIEVAEAFDDGSQVWKTEVADGEATLPVYVHVTQNEEGQWLLNRVLFAQEIAKYENQ